MNDRIKAILFPTDFSPNSMHAALYAAMLARRYDAKLIILHVFSNVISMSLDPNMINDQTFLEDQLQKNARQNLEVFTKNLVQNTELISIQVEQILEYGFVKECIIEISEQNNVDMIVMGTTGTSNLIEKWIGSNAENVVQSANCPVWIIPNNCQIKVPQTFLYAADLEEDEKKATKTLLEFATPFGANCKVIHIHEYFDLNVMGKTKELINDLKKEFKKDKITFKDLNRKEIVEGIETYTKNHKPDVLVFTVYEKNLFSNLFNSSITKHFISDAKIPMLIFKKEIS
jgi:nucleotide-binding universal stress UspA family protein